MKHRTLGNGLEVSAIGIGTMPMIRGGNILYGHADDDVSTRTIHEAIDLGVTFFDTAEMYGPFTNEELVGQAIKGRRDGLVIATKFAMRWDGDRMVGLDGSPANARRACEGSLKRLGIETIDLFYQHRVDPNVPIEETVGGMAELVKEGKIRHIGLSEAGAGDSASGGQDPPDRGAADRILDLGTRRGGRDPADLPRDMASASCPTARSAGVSWPAASARSPTCPPTTGATTIRAIRRRTCPRTWPSSTRWARWRAPRRLERADRPGLAAGPGR